MDEAEKAWCRTYRELALADLKPIISWLSEEALEEVASSSYWNDPELEKEKEWCLEDINDVKAIRHVREETNLEEAFRAGILFLEKWQGHELQGVCLDLGAGVCWTSALVAQKPRIKRILAVEISRHRLESLAPLVLRQYQVQEEKIIRVLGDFAEIKLEDNSVDLVVMSQAFHHANQVEKLLLEVARVLSPGGGFIVTGERLVSRKEYLVRVLRHNFKSLVMVLGMEKYLASLRGRAFSRLDKPFGLGWDRVFPPDPVTGDHYYNREMVVKMFMQSGLMMRFQPLRKVPGKKILADYNYIARKP